MRAGPRAVALALWGCVIVGGAYVAILDRGLLRGGLRSIAAASPVGAATVYLVIACLRGFTLVPATLLIVAGLPFFDPSLLFVLTMVGIVVSATNIYWFSQSLALDEYFERRHPAQVAQLRRALERYELPVIVGWAFLPFAPTDVIGYVCGSLRINFGKYLLGIVLGEGVICALYIFLGMNAVRWLALVG
ncbi:MAG TPA: VTT domain-containing protein [Gemmatimonadaceae bacterium]|nr:VTT domain-containing protein [Gemmatimonadaceae bacterium]